MFYNLCFQRLLYLFFICKVISAEAIDILSASARKHPVFCNTRRELCCASSTMKTDIVGTYSIPQCLPIPLSSLFRNTRRELSCASSTMKSNAVANIKMFQCNVSFRLSKLKKLKKGKKRGIM